MQTYNSLFMKSLTTCSSYICSLYILPTVCAETSLKTDTYKKCANRSRSIAIKRQPQMWQMLSNIYPHKTAVYSHCPATVRWTQSPCLYWRPQRRWCWRPAVSAWRSPCLANWSGWTTSSGKPRSPVSVEKYVYINWYVINLFAQFYDICKTF